MKIGILTFHRAYNYGAVLQCYALQEDLKELGHDVEVIDYKQPFIDHIYQIYNWDLIRGCFRHPLGFYKFIKLVLPLRKLKRKNFGNFRNQYLTTSNPCTATNIPQDYDFYVIGSDQLWGINCLGGQLDPVYFGEFKHKESAKIIGYAISTDNKSLKSAPQKQLSNWLQNFHALSLREQSMSDLLYNCMGTKSHVDLDPTLLLDKEKWNFTPKIDWSTKKYVIVYYAGRPIGKYAHNELLRKASAISNHIGAEVVDLSSMKYAVEDFVMSFKYAQCVVTSSFHATVFSVIFNTPLYSVKLHDGHDGRYVNLLKNLGMEESLIEMDDFVEVPPMTDYTKVNYNLSLLREKSLEYITKSLS